MKSYRESRRSPRHPVAFDCQVITDRSEVAAELHCSDISLHGARVESGLSPAKGEVVVLSLTPSRGGAELTLFARVTHVIKNGFSVRGFGVEFVSASASDLALLEEALHGDVAA